MAAISTAKTPFVRSVFVAQQIHNKSQHAVCGGFVQNPQKSHKWSLIIYNILPNYLYTVVKTDRHKARSAVFGEIWCQIIMMQIARPWRRSDRNNSLSERMMSSNCDTVHESNGSYAENCTISQWPYHLRHGRPKHSPSSMWNITVQDNRIDLEHIICWNVGLGLPSLTITSGKKKDCHKVS